MRLNLIAALAVVLLIGACSAPQKKEKQEKTNLETIASSDIQWTGVAVSKTKRVFVNYPLWSKNVPVSVAEIKEGKAIPYPNSDWNNRKNEEAFQAVQSVYVDKKNRLWILDTHNPFFQGVDSIGPMLYQFDLQTNSKTKAYNFEKGIYKTNSYFNDVRVDTEKEIAYMTDSSDGAIIVLDLKSGSSRRLLDNHLSTESEVDSLVCDGHVWKNSIHSDGIALSPDRNYLYYIALTAHTLYKIPTVALLNDTLSENKLSAKVETVQKVPATDGMLFDTKGNLWMGGLEDNSINKLTPESKIEKVVKDAQIKWADSFAQDTDGAIYFTTSQIHLPPNKRKKYEVIRLTP